MTGFTLCNLFMTILYHSNVIVSICCITNKKIGFFVIIWILQPMLCLQTKGSFDKIYHNRLRRVYFMKCKNCGIEYIGKSCPNCGMKRKTMTPAKVFIVIIAVILFGTFCSALRRSWEKPEEMIKKPAQSDQQQTNVEENKPNIMYYITATELLDEVKENGVAADSKYKDKVIQVTGKVGSINNDISGHSYVTLVHYEDIFSITTVQCYFDKKNIEQIVNLKPDEIITVYGTYKNRTLNVSLKNCQVVTE